MQSSGAPSAMTLLASVCDDIRRTRAGVPRTRFLGRTPLSVRAAPTLATVSDEQWNWLQFLCPAAAAGAAEILDSQREIRCYVATRSKRKYCVIAASSQSAHCTIPGFCTCRAFCYQVAAKPEALVCKHELAVLLADALGRVQEKRDVEDDVWAAEFSLAMSAPMVAYSQA
eukprot:6588174-Prymnesium_polylepis.1